MLQRMLSTALLAKYAYSTGGSKHPAKTMSLASNEHIDNQCCNMQCNDRPNPAAAAAAAAAAASVSVPGSVWPEPLPR